MHVPARMHGLRHHRPCQGVLVPPQPAVSTRIQRQIAKQSVKVQSASELVTDIAPSPSLDQSQGGLPAQPHSMQVEFLHDDRFPFTVRGLMTLPNCEPGLVWEIITAYEACADVFRSIESSSVQEKDGRLELIQKCSWSFLAFSGTFDTHLAVQQDEAARSLVFTLIQSSFMKDFEGRWNVTTSQSDAQQCVVEHVLSVKPLVPVPPPFSYYTRSIFVRQVEAVLQDLHKEIVRQQALAGAARN